LKGWVENGAEPIFLDIREPAELSSGIVEGAFLIPMNQIPDRVDELPRDQKLIVYCAAGVRSFGVTHWLREQGFEDTWSLIGGAGAWFYAGFDPHRPAMDAPLALLRPVKIPAETLEAHDIAPEGAPLSGAVHAVYRLEDADTEGSAPDYRYDLRVFLSGGSSVMLNGLTDADFQPIGRVPGR
jgi:rhodanese-related sulfurtransferase